MYALWPPAAGIAAVRIGTRYPIGERWTWRCPLLAQFLRPTALITKIQTLYDCASPSMARWRSRSRCQLLQLAHRWGIWNLALAVTAAISLSAPAASDRTVGSAQLSVAFFATILTGEAGAVVEIINAAQPDVLLAMLGWAGVGDEL